MGVPDCKVLRVFLIIEVLMGFSFLFQGPAPMCPPHFLPTPQDTRTYQVPTPVFIHSFRIREMSFPVPGCVISGSGLISQTTTNSVLYLTKYILLCKPSVVTHV